MDKEEIEKIDDEVFNMFFEGLRSKLFGAEREQLDINKNAMRDGIRAQRDIEEIEKDEI